MPDRSSPAHAEPEQPANISITNRREPNSPRLIGPPQTRSYQYLSINESDPNPRPRLLLPVDKSTAISTRKRSATAGGIERGKLSELFHKIKCAHRDCQPARSRTLSELAGSS